MKCSRCDIEVGNLFCGKCRAEIRKKQGQLISVLYFDPNSKLYRAGCSVLECPCNENGICSSRITLDTFKHLAHEYDGDNCVRMVCG
jgi:hypothetical protein